MLLSKLLSTPFFLEQGIGIGYNLAMKQKKSFTLIEILVVIVVIGILSAFILVGMSSISSKANIARSQAFANSLDNALLLSRTSQWKLDGNINDSWGINTGTWYGATGGNNLAVNYRSSSECVSGQCLDFTAQTIMWIMGTS